MSHYLSKEIPSVDELTNQIYPRHVLQIVQNGDGPRSKKAKRNDDGSDNDEENGAHDGDASAAPEAGDETVAEPTRTVRDIYMDGKPAAEKMQELLTFLDHDFEMDVVVTLSSVVEPQDVRSINTDHLKFIAAAYKSKGIDAVLHHTFLILFKENADSQTSYTVDGQHRVRALKIYNHWLTERNNGNGVRETITADFVIYGHVTLEQKVLITAFAEQKASEFKREYADDELLKNARRIVKYFPAMINANLKLAPNKRLSAKDKEAFENVHGMSINEELCNILHVKNGRLIKSSWWKTSWFNDVDFEAAFAGILQTTNNNRFLDRICANYRTCPKKIVSILSNPDIYNDMETFKQELLSCTVLYEYEAWLKNFNTWDITKSEAWHQQFLMGDNFGDYNAPQREELLNKIFSNGKLNGIDSSNMKRNNPTINERLRYLKTKCISYLEIRDDNAAVEVDEEDEAAAGEQKKHGTRGTKILNLKVNIDDFEKEYLDAWDCVRPQGGASKVAAVLCNFVRRHCVNLEKVEKNTLFARASAHEKIGGRIEVGMDPDTRETIYTPSAPTKEPYVSDAALRTPHRFTEIPKAAKKVRKGALKRRSNKQNINEETNFADEE